MPSLQSRRGTDFERKVKMEKPITDDFFWDLIEESNVQECMAQVILQSHKELTEQLRIRAESFSRSSLNLAGKAWLHFAKLNGVESPLDLPRYHADLCSRSIREAK